MRPVSAVVVDFPLVPVIAITRPVNHHDASSISPTIGTPWARAATTAGCSAGTPGLITIRSAAVNVAVSWPPSSRATPCARSGTASGTLARTSDSVTAAPCFASSAAAAIPLAAAPTTVTRLPLTTGAMRSLPFLPRSSSPQLQRGQAEERKHDRGNHKPRDHFRLAPADQLEVMMERRHPEHALSGRLERRDLDDD